MPSNPNHAVHICTSEGIKMCFSVDDKCDVIVGTNVRWDTRLDNRRCRRQGNDGDGSPQHSGDYLLRHGGPARGSSLTPVNKWR